MSKLRRALLILAAVAGIFVVFGLFIAQDPETLRIRSAVAAEDPASVSYLSDLVGVAVTGENAFTVLTNGDEIFPRMLDAIGRARRRINFETYIYDTGEIANTFTAALEAAARRGVVVNIVVDSVGSGSMDPEHTKRLRAAGCKVFTYNESGFYELEAINYRTHRKILVVDGETTFTGGVGVADHWLGNAQGKDHWRDTQVELRGPAARILEGVFSENFIESGEIIAPVLDPAGPEPTRDGNTLVVKSSSTGGSTDLKRLYLLMIAFARKSLDIETPYFVTDSSTEWAIEDAIARGVVVRILMESDLTDAKPVKYASRRKYDRLLSLGAQLHQYQSTMMHAKVIVVDGMWSMFGSANFDNRSLELNDEINVAVRSPELAARFLEDFENDLKSTHRFDLAEWRKRSFFDKEREQFWSLFGEVF